MTVDANVEEHEVEFSKDACVEQREYCICFISLIHVYMIACNALKIFVYKFFNNPPHRRQMCSACCNSSLRS